MSVVEHAQPPGRALVRVAICHSRRPRADGARRFTPALGARYTPAASSACQRSRSPAWHVSTSQSAASVAKRTALAAVLEYRQVGGRDPYASRELAHGISAWSASRRCRWRSASDHIVQLGLHLRRFYVARDGLSQQHPQHEHDECDPRISARSVALPRRVRLARRPIPRRKPPVSASARRSGDVRPHRWAAWPVRSGTSIRTLRPGLRGFAQNEWTRLDDHVHTTEALRTRARAVLLVFKQAAPCQCRRTALARIGGRRPPMVASGTTGKVLLISSPFGPARLPP
jgi:hypothetical protein